MCLCVFLSWRRSTRPEVTKPSASRHAESQSPFSSASMYLNFMNTFAPRVPIIGARPGQTNKQGTWTLVCGRSPCPCSRRIILEFQTFQPRHNLPWDEVGFVSSVVCLAIVVLPGMAPLLSGGRERERQRDTERDTERNREGLRARETEIEIEPPVDAGCGNRRCRRICFFRGQRSTWTTRTIFAPSKSAPCICTLCHPTSMPSCQALIASWFPPEARVLGSQTDMSAASGNCIQHIGLGFKGSQWRSL